jgi:hypothetical protein
METQHKTRPQWKRWQEEDGRWDNTLMNRLKKFYRKGFPMTVYRAIDLAEGQTPNLRGFGKHWTWDEKAAKRYSPADWGSSEFSGLPKHTYVFKGIIHDKNSVNWRETLGYNDCIPDEREIQLNSGAEIEVVGYRKVDEKEWKTPAFKMVTASDPPMQWDGGVASVHSVTLGQKVSASDVCNYIFELHDDEEETNIPERVYMYDVLGFVLKEVNLSDIDAEWNRSEDRINEYAKMTTSMPPVVLDDNLTVIDGTHRVHAAIQRGEKTIRAFVPVAPKLKTTAKLETGLRRQPDYMEPGSYTVRDE